MKNKLFVVTLLGCLTLLNFRLIATAQPVLTSLPATGIGPSSATFNGTVNPNGLSTSVYYQYGQTTNYGNIIGLTNLPATNTAITLPGTLVTSLHSAAGAYGTYWHSRLAVGGWSSIASSADGSRQVAAVPDDGFYTSTNYGLTWTFASKPYGTCVGVASSVNGLRLAIAMNGGGIYTSTDGGVTLTQSFAGYNVWQAIASSADGLRLAAMENYGGIYTSTNGGTSWLQTSAPDEYWRSIASSADGKRLVAVPDSGPVYTSTDSGTTWTPSSTQVGYWESVASSADGIRLVAAGYNNVYFSTNGGNAWTLAGVPTAISGSNWQAVAISAEGSLMAATGPNETIYISTNTGSSWFQSSAQTTNWTSLACSADGTLMTAGGPDLETCAGSTANLAPGTTYHYQLVGYNSAGYNSVGGDQVFTTTSGAPTFSYYSFYGTTTNVTPFGTLTTAGLDTILYARYGTTTSYGSYSATNFFPGTNVSMVVSNLISNLTPDTSYHFQLVAQNSAGTATSGDVFILTARYPYVTTLPAVSITPTNFMLNGTVNPNALDTTFYFQYGLTTSYGSYSTTNVLTATNISLAVSNVIKGLTPGVTYHFQLVASNSQGISTGGDLTFNTDIPTTTTLPATSVSPTNATLNGTVNPNGYATAAYFQYGLTTSYGSIGGLTLFSATNTTFSIPGLMINSLHGPAGANWASASVPATNWQSIASSADGTHLAAVVYGGGIYASTNSGATWIQTSAPVTNWESIASSADGTRLAAVSKNDGVYASANEGLTWTKTSATNGVYWYSIVSSTDGSHLAASVYGGGIYTSADGGVTWTNTGAPNAKWTLASSADGTHLTAAAYGYSIQTSTNGGASWTVSGSIAGNWTCVASSADGTRLAAAIPSGGGIYTSTNSGTTWTKAPGFSGGNWSAITTSADGSLLAVANNGGNIYTSINGGANWSPTGAPYVNWTSIASSADGTQLAAAASGDSLYTSAGTVANLLPGTLYHFQLFSDNSFGIGQGGDLTFTTSAGAPTAGLQVTGSTTTNAIFNSTVTTGGLDTSAYIRYGLTTAYGNYTATNLLAAANVALSVSNLVGNLTPGVAYHFQLVASNSAGVALSGDVPVITVTPASVTTWAAISNGPTDYLLYGTVNPNGFAATAYFQYGLTTNYGSYSATNTLAATNLVQSITNLISGLWPNSTYHFQLVANNYGGTTMGGDIAFSTAVLLPAVTTLPATSITTSNAILHCSVNPNGTGASAYIQYGLTTNYGSISPLWNLAATNTPQMLPDLPVSSVPGAAWMDANPAGVPATNWQSIASSADGSQLAAVIRGGGIYTSTNSGGTWAQTSAPVTNWESIASSSDGIRLAAVAINDAIYTSTNSGLTWARTSATNGVYWYSIASSADGSHLAAAVSGGGIYASTNGGGTWTKSSAGNATWYSIAASADGTRLAAVIYAGDIAFSTNSGLTFGLTGFPTNWTSIASSADGMRLAAVAYGGGIYISTNGGFNWLQTSAPSGFNWFCIASSADGSHLAAVEYPGIIFNSADYGATWQADTSANTHWTCVASSADGTHLAAGATGGDIYTANNVGVNLTPGTTYHYRAAGRTVAGLAYGNDLTFTTSPAAPTATTLAASGITTNTAILNGTLTTGGLATSVYFQYGLTPSYGSYTTTNTLLATNVILSVTNLISGLSPGTTYHFQLVAGNSQGTNTGSDLTFTTAYAQALNFGLTGAVRLPGGTFLFGFTNVSGMGFTVLTTTNLTTPLSNWTVLGAPVEAPPGQYQFTDPQATNAPMHFYRVSSP